MEGNHFKKAKVVNEGDEVPQEHSIVSGIAIRKDELHVLQSDEIFSLDGVKSDIEAPPLPPSSGEEIRKSMVIKSKEEKPRPFHSESFKLFIDYGSRLKKIHGKLINVPSYETDCVKVVDPKLSTNAIIRLAGEKFIEFMEGSCEDLLMARYIFSEQFSGLNREDARDVELVFHLLAAAEKIGEKQFVHARKLLEHCEELSSSIGDPVQRLVYYFCNALNEKIDQETMKTTPLNMGMKHLLDVEKGMMSVSSVVLALNKVHPACHVIQLAGVQAVVEHVGKVEKIHIIDFAIRGGQHHSMLIQALAVKSEFHIEHLKITAVGTTSKSKIEEAGSRLISFAQALSLPFSFHVVMVDDILNLEEGLLSVDPNATLVVYSSYFLRSMLGQPDRLESLMRVIRNTKPCLMVVPEVESNHNSPVFVNRFIEALFFFGAQFDSLEDLMKNDESNRSIMESFYFSKGIQNIVSTEGEQRAFREVKIDVWRSFFHRFGMLETPLSTSSLSQANLVRNNYSCGSSCTLDMDGESLIVGWKETPLYSLSVWTFK